MKLKSFLPSALALTLSAVASTLIAAPLQADFLGEPAPSAAAERTIPIGADTKYVNVTEGEAVQFVVGGQTITWDFETAQGVSSLPLNKILPGGTTLDHDVKVYVAPDPRRYRGGWGG